MPENNDFWDFYWEMRLLPMENLGKRAAILAASELIRTLAQQVDHPLRLLELGCGEGQVIGTLLDAHFQLCAVQASVGVDYNAQSLAQCQRDYPGLRCVKGDFTDPDLLAGLGKFELVLLVNALHEVFSDSFSPELGEIDVPAASRHWPVRLAAWNPEGGWFYSTAWSLPGIRINSCAYASVITRYVRNSRTLLSSIILCGSHIARLKAHCVLNYRSVILPVT
jgi:SAM-dependent methyltransferase